MAGRFLGSPSAEELGNQCLQAIQMGGATRDHLGLYENWIAPDDLSSFSHEHDTFGVLHGIPCTPCEHTNHLSNKTTSATKKLIFQESSSLCEEVRCPASGLHAPSLGEGIPPQRPLTMMINH